jgi:hypothetical protein
MPVRAVSAAWLVLGLTAGSAVSGCADEPAAPTTAQLVAELEFLEAQQQLSPAQVRCVAEDAARRLDDGELATFRAELHDLNENGSADALGRSSREALTEGLAACAVDGFDG